LATTQDYQNLVKAEKLLASNSQNGSLTTEDKLEMAAILASRPEPVSRFKAIGLLEEVSRSQPLNEAAGITLADLYYNTGDWSKYSRQIEKAIATYPESAASRENYIRKLLVRGDKQSIEEATEQLGRLRQIAPQDPAVFELTVRLAGKIGREQQVRGELLRLVPDFAKIKELTPQQAQMLSMLAALFIELKDLESAERIYTEMAARDVNHIPALANFLGIHRNVEECFAKLDEVYAPERTLPILQVAMSVVRQRRDAVGDKFDENIQRWLDAGLRENPDSIPLMIVQADLYDLQERYDDAAAIYSKLLDRSDLIGLRRAVVLNNLSFLVALAGSEAKVDDDPLKLVQEAASIMGPNSDILDTRAVVLMAMERYKQAIQDLELAVTDNPTASKYFHLADAHLRDGGNRAAVQAWEKAEELGLSRDAINRLEIDRYEEMKTKIGQIRGSAVTQNAPRRRAG
jgi:cellulose synthase operon protein C